MHKKKGIQSEDVSKILMVVIVILVAVMIIGNIARDRQITTLHEEIHILQKNDIEQNARIRIFENLHDDLQGQLNKIVEGLSQ